MPIDPPNDGLVGLADRAPHAPIGIVPNAPHQGTRAGLMHATDYDLAIVEFDDQGRCYDRGQMEAVAAHLAAMQQGRCDVIVLVFVHGWKHDARSDDENLTRFRILLAQASAYERQETPSGATPRAVLGVFVGWRGMSAFGLGDAVANATFWDRQTAGHRVATGSVRELFGRLRSYREGRRAAGGSPLLVIAGHSFGGMIVYSALAQSLVEAACAPADHLVPSFADLVLLINPAFEAARYLPVHDVVTSPGFQARTTAQLPLFLCVQARNDQPVGTWFPIGNSGRKADEATIGDLERDCVAHAIGFVPAFRTHRLEGPAGGKPFVLTPEDIHRPNPFWVVEATEEVIDGHGGIWERSFRLFVASIVFGRMQASQGPRAGLSATATPQAHPPSSPAGGVGFTDLASFAQQLQSRIPF